MNRRETIVYKFSKHQALLCDQFKEAEIVDNGLRFVSSLDEEQVSESNTFAEAAAALHDRCGDVPLAPREWRRVMMIAVRERG